MVAPPLFRSKLARPSVTAFLQALETLNVLQRPTKDRDEREATVTARVTAGGDTSFDALDW